MSPGLQLSNPITEWSPRSRWLSFGGLGVLAALGNPPVGLPVLTMLAVLAVAWLRPWILPTRQGFWAGWALGAGYFALTFHWLIEPFLVDVAAHGWMAPFAVLGMAAGLALFWGAGFAIAARVQSPIVWAVAWAAAEYLRGNILTGFPWAMTVTNSVDVLLYQAAAWVGPYGLTLLVLVAAILGARRDWWAAAIWVPLCAVALIPAPKAAAPGADAPVIRVVQPNAPQDQKWDKDMIPVFWDRKITATRAEPAADFTLWPETSVPNWLRNADAMFEVVGRAANAPVMVGVQRYDGQAYNGVGLIDADGVLSDLYDKVHLVPFGEYMPLASLFARFGIYGLAANEGFGYAAGTNPKAMQVPGIGLVRPLICYESVFPDEIVVGARPRLLAVATNDAWFGQLGGPAQHLQQSQARAIEQGIPVARAANTGISAIIDARGQIVAALPLGVAGHVDAALPGLRPATLYGRMGDWGFGGLLLGVAFFHVLRSRRRISELT